METSTPGAAGLVLGFATMAMAVTYGYFRRVQLPPPRFGVLNVFDIAVMITAVIAVPYLFLLVPTAVMTVLLVLAFASILDLALEPVLPRPARWAIVLAALGAEMTAYWTTGPGSAAFASANNIVVCLVAVATANLWAQSGLTVRRAVI